MSWFIAKRLLSLFLTLLLAAALVLVAVVALALLLLLTDTALSVWERLTAAPGWVRFGWLAGVGAITVGATFLAWRWLQPKPETADTAALPTLDPDRLHQEAVLLAEDHGLDIVLVGGRDAWMITDFLKEKDVPVILLTAKAGTESRLAGLEQGADDYLVKPFDLPELEARLRALVRRAQGASARRGRP